ncbi:MAG: type VI secretion system tip protein VgrG [Phycisphaeraceae bacterium]|nr:type VI secretion system tip protein VgrG [Phycisphaerae bacterium]MBX3393720.1 type VI secretion system tip protein VgrG [Phycisphaeraceae bacterium]HRJ49080.1 type VI secretion system tip protein VgrG [Phycisphaerales bacterium]
MPITQDNRFISIDTPLGKDKLLLARFSCRETLSRLYEIDAEVASEDFAVDFDKVLGQPVTIKVMRGDNSFRFFSGIVSRMVQTSGPGDMARYEMRIVPWLWLLTRTADCRIFQNKKIPDIVKEVLGRHAFADFKTNLSGDYQTREYQVQYRETDFNFVSRLLEQEGIAYYFLHDDKGKHTMHLVDAPTAYNPYKGYEKIDWSPASGGALDKQVILDWTYEKSVQPGKYATTDYNFKTPSTPLLAPAENLPAHAAKEFEIFDPPGEYEAKAAGDEIAKVRLQELQAMQEAASGVGNSRGIACGCVFELNNPPREAWKNKKWLVTEAVHRAVSDPFYTARSGSGDEFSTRFTVVDSLVLWRPARSTPKPTIPGPQTAFVCGPKGNDIHTDEYGRVKVKFHWDRESKADENSSCWIRVCQRWAGKQWGTIMIPRTGQEVVVEFIEGDPDRPIITGSVYNAETNVPYALPDMACISSWSSLSTPDGKGYNEIAFNDKKDSEMLFLRAQKDMDLWVGNDQRIQVGNDTHLTVKNDQYVKIENNRHEEVVNDVKVKIGKDDHLTIKGLQAVKITKSRSTTVEDDVIDVFKKNHSEEVTSDYYLKATQIVLEASSNITLKVGSNSIAIDGSGIGLSCANFKLKASANAELNASAGMKLETTGTLDIKGSVVKIAGQGMLEAKSPMTTVKGDGMLILKGGLVMIN